MKRKSILIWGLAILLLCSIGVNMYLTNQRTATLHFFLARNETMLGSDMMHTSGCVQSILEGKSSVAFQAGMLTSVLMDGSMRATDITSYADATNGDYQSWHTIYASLDKANGLLVKLSNQMAAPTQTGITLTAQQVQQLKSIRSLADDVLGVIKTSNVNTGEVQTGALQKAVTAAKQFLQSDL